MSVLRGDCVEVMAGMEPDSVDAIVCDPPYDLLSSGDRNGSGRSNPGTGPFGRTEGRGGFMGQRWDATGVAFRPETWAAALRVAKPGAYLLAFGGTRTVHRMTCALEDAGWVIRDMLVWAYAQGFPKSRASLKPAWEPIVLARKPGPLRDLNIDAARIGTTVETWPQSRGYSRHDPGSPVKSTQGTGEPPPGRWPANVILTDPIFDGGWEGVVGGGETGKGAFPGEYRRKDREQYRIGSTGEQRDTDTGTASRYFYIPKAPTRERVLSDGRRSPHPTQKPEALIRHLVTLVTPQGGTVLDPFLGSGTLGVVCEGLGVRWVGIEREPEYADWAEDRVRDGQPRWDGIAQPESPFNHRCQKGDPCPVCLAIVQGEAAS